MFYQKILEYSLIVSQIKADSWRFESARERYNLLLETHPEIIKRAPLAHIASYLLMTPETLKPCTRLVFYDFMNDFPVFFWILWHIPV